METNTKKRSHVPNHSLHSSCDYRNSKRARTSSNSVDLFDNSLFLNDDLADELCSQILDKIDTNQNKPSQQFNLIASESRQRLIQTSATKSLRTANASTKSPNSRVALTKSYSSNAPVTNSYNSSTALSKSSSFIHPTTKSSIFANSNKSIVSSNSPCKGSTTANNLPYNNSNDNIKNQRENKFFKSRNCQQINLNNRSNNITSNLRTNINVTNEQKNYNWSSSKLISNHQSCSIQSKSNQSNSITHSNSNSKHNNSSSIQFVPNSPEHTAFVSQISLTIQDDSSVSTATNSDKLKINSQSSQKRFHQKEQIEKFCTKMKELKLVFEAFDANLVDDENDEDNNEKESDSDTDSVSVVYDTDEDEEEVPFNIGQYYKSINSLMPNFNQTIENVNTSLHFLNTYLDVYSQSELI